MISKKRKIIFLCCLPVLLLVLVSCMKHGCLGPDAREKAIGFMRFVGLGEKLNAPVKVSAYKSGITCISDHGKYIAQYMIDGPNNRSDPEIVVEASVNIPASCTNPSPTACAINGLNSAGFSRKRLRNSSRGMPTRNGYCRWWAVKMSLILLNNRCQPAWVKSSLSN